MQKRVLFAYKWATMGGVERVLLNRAQVFQETRSDFIFDVYFLHDSGGRAAFQRHIDDCGLGRTVRVVDRLDEELYDLLVSIDTPELFQLISDRRPIAIECHTGYAQNRDYLNSIPASVTAVAVPSEGFFSSIMAEKGDLGGRLSLLRNFVCAPAGIDSVDLPDWSKQPVVYLGRMDKLKNVTEALEGARIFRERFGDRIVLVLVGPRSTEVDIIREIGSRGLLDCTMLLPAVEFGGIWSLLAGLAKKNAILTSCSTAESFGLSVAEALSVGLPVLVSNIEAHRLLVSDSSEYLYQLGDPADWALALARLMNRECDIQESSQRFKDVFGSEAFLKDWDRFFTKATEHERRKPSVFG